MATFNCKPRNRAFNEKREIGRQEIKTCLIQHRQDANGIHNVPLTFLQTRRAYKVLTEPTVYLF